ncbi:MAG TPA: ATP-binding cassette domain-containing protein [Rhizobiales bacterium]|nr:ATP-binding cassette domain-containing protein [Hyphomicrobiales bacterium]
MLEVKGLYNDILKPVSLELAAGECISLEGASGAGKTVFLRALADLDEACGEVFLNGAERNTMSAPQWRKGVRYLAAEPGFWETTLAGHFDTACLDPGREILVRLGLAGDAMNWRIERMSTGEKQRAGLALGLASNPAVILADEPTSALDAQAAGRVEELLRARMKDGAAIVLVSHDPAFAWRLADRRFVIRDGQISAEAS